MGYGPEFNNEYRRKKNFGKRWHSLIKHLRDNWKYIPGDPNIGTDYLTPDELKNLEAYKKGNKMRYELEKSGYTSSEAKRIVLLALYPPQS